MRIRAGVVRDWVLSALVLAIVLPLGAILVGPFGWSMLPPLAICVLISVVIGTGIVWAISRYSHLKASHAVAVLIGVWIVVFGISVVLAVAFVEMPRGLHSSLDSAATWAILISPIPVCGIVATLAVHWLRRRVRNESITER